MRGSLPEIINMPWLLRNEILRIVFFPWIRLIFGLSGVKWGKNWRVFGAPRIQRCRGSIIKVGDGLVMRSWVASNPVAPNHPVFLSTRTAQAVIRIGNRFGITGGSIISAESVEIGDDVFIGANCLITDTDFHPLLGIDRVRDPKDGISQPVVIGDNAFIGANSTLLKGSSIGAGTVIGAGSVVAGDIPPRVIAAGNPARIIRQLSSPDGVS